MTVGELSDYITRRKKNQKSQYLNEVQNDCTHSRIRIARISIRLQISGVKSFGIYSIKILRISVLMKVLIGSVE